MPVISRVIRQLLHQIINISWGMVLILFFGHAVLSYGLLAILGEGDLTDKVVTFVYFYLVTASTVGFGDLSPSGDYGRLIVAGFVLPGANLIFMLVIGKFISEINNLTRNMMNGLSDYSKRAGHFVVVGYQDLKTGKLLSETEDLHGSDDVVLVTKTDRDTSHIKATPIKTHDLSSRQALARAGVEKASHIVVLARDDSETLAASLAISSLKPSGHVVAYFDGRESADLLQAHCPNFECVVSTSIEQVSRAMTDPGASKVLSDISCSLKSSTLMSCTVCDKHAGTPAIEFNLMLASAKANMIGIMRQGQEDVDFDVASQQPLSKGDVAYYIAKERLDPESLVAA